MKKKIKIENESSNNYLSIFSNNNDKLENKNLITVNRKNFLNINTNLNIKESKFLFNTKDINSENSITNNNPSFNSKTPKGNITLLPIKNLKKEKTKEHKIDNFRLFFRGKSSQSNKINEVNIKYTQYNRGNNQISIVKKSKEFIIPKLNVQNNNNIKETKDITTDEKNKNKDINQDLRIKTIKISNINKKSNIILNELKNKRNALSRIKPIKTNKDNDQNNIDNINNNSQNKLYGISPEIIKTKLPRLYHLKKNSSKIKEIINMNFIQKKNTIISPIFRNKKSAGVQKRSEIIQTDNEFNNQNDKESTFGKIINWKKIELLYEGEFSYIYKAFNVTNGHIFVVKNYKNSKNKKLFLNEVKYLKMFRQNNIVRFIDAEIINNVNYYIYLDLIGGYSLKDFYSKVGFFTKPLFIIFIKQIIEFLDYMKGLGLAYNNFSFSHIMFDLNGNIQIIDFSKTTMIIELRKNNSIKNYEDSDFINFKDMIFRIFDFEKSNTFNKQEFSNDFFEYCTWLESILNNVTKLRDFKYSIRNKEN